MESQILGTGELESRWNHRPGAQEGWNHKPRALGSQNHAGTKQHSLPARCAIHAIPVPGSPAGPGGISPFWLMSSARVIRQPRLPSGLCLLAAPCPGRGSAGWGSQPVVQGWQPWNKDCCHNQPGEFSAALAWTGRPGWERCSSVPGRWAMGRRAGAAPQLLISEGLGCQAGVPGWQEGARSAEPPALCSCISSLAGAASEQTAKARAYGNAYLTGIYIQQCLSAALFSFPNALIPPGSQLGRPGKGRRPWQG